MYGSNCLSKIQESHSPDQRSTSVTVWCSFGLDKRESRVVALCSSPFCAFCSFRICTCGAVMILLLCGGIAVRRSNISTEFSRRAACLSDLKCRRAPKASHKQRKITNTSASDNEDIHIMFRAHSGMAARSPSSVS